MTNESFFQKTLMIFGGAGSLGHSLVNKYLPLCKNIFVVSRDEAKHWELHNQFNYLFPEHKSKLITIIGDVREKNRIKELINRYAPENIIIAQALKQVDLCEMYPEE